MQAITMLPYLLLQLPAALPPLVGLVIAVMNWKKHRTVSLLALIGFVLLLVNLVLGMLTTLSPFAMLQSGMRVASYGAIMGVVGVLRTLLETIGLSLLVAAIFMGRKPAQSVETAVMPPDSTR